jgi:hypothetical protein
MEKFKQSLDMVLDVNKEISDFRENYPSENNKI